MRNGMNDGAGATRGESVHRLSRFMRDVALSRAAPPPQPGSVEALAGVFIAEVRRIWEDRNVGDYLAASEARRHVWHCWMASERDTIERRFRAFPALALRRLTAHKARDLLAGAYGSCPPGLVKALGRCGPEARSREFYRNLVLALKGEPGRAKAVWHAPVLTDALVLEATSLPAQTPAPRPTPFGSPIVDLDAMAGEHLNTAPLPAPPWAGTARLRPLTSRQDLRDMGRRLRNCMRSWGRVRVAAEAITAGREAYYAWDAPGPGLLRFALGPMGWSLAEWLGTDNDPLSDEAESEIIASLEGWPGVTVSAPRGKKRRTMEHRPRFTPDGRRICRYTGEVRDLLDCLERRVTSARWPPARSVRGLTAGRRAIPAPVLVRPQLSQRSGIGGPRRGAHRMDRYETHRLAQFAASALALDEEGLRRRAGRPQRSVAKWMVEHAEHLGWHEPIPVDGDAFDMPIGRLDRKNWEALRPAAEALRAAAKAPAPRASGLERRIAWLGRTLSLDALDAAILALAVRAALHRPLYRLA